jgi:RNA polymerase sigma-70 factor (ECF subfamily)
MSYFREEDLGDSFLAFSALQSHFRSRAGAAQLDPILITAWANCLSTLSIGSGVQPDSTALAPVHTPLDRDPVAFCRDNFGFVLNIFRLQPRSDTLPAQANAIRLILLTDNFLRRIQKERILLAVSGVNQNTYFVAVYSEILALMGVPVEDSYQIAEDHSQVNNLPDPDHALLDFAIKLSTRPAEFSLADIQCLRQFGFSDEQIMEAISVTALTQFLNTLQQGLGCAPDFPPRRSLFRSDKIANLSAPDSRPTPAEASVDPDSELVARAQSGDLEAFEVLVDRHGKRVYRALVGMLGNTEEARDAMQDTFLKAFQHLASFQGRSKFSTWLVSIASNTGLQRMRDRKPMESLDDEGPESDEKFRPRQVRAWTDDPEQLYSQAERSSLVEKCVMSLPAKYRVVVLMRDFEQLSAEEAAAALGLGVPALKSRLLRGRLMLREALAPYFAKNPQGAGV